jgi:6-phosphogluconolactonase
VSVEIEVVDDPARACAAMLLGPAAGAGHIVLSGGSTPKAAYGQLVGAVRANDVDLSATTFWFGDERAVPPEDPRSNYRMVKESLLDPLGGANRPILHRMEGELGQTAGADAYEQALRDAGPPRFDILLLGIGPDGHTLSLFPDQPTVQERSRLVIGVDQAGHEPYVPRISFTLPALRLAERVVVLASGESKAGPLAAAFGRDAKPTPQLPSSMVPLFADHVILLLDRAAAAQL